MTCRGWRKRACCACRSFFQQLMVAVDYCHAMGIRIQDLRPHNMLLVEPNDAPSLCRCAPTCAAPMHVRNFCREYCFDNLYAGSHCKMIWEWQTLT